MAVPLTAKQARISYVWLVGAVLTFLWTVLEWLWITPPAPVVAAFTALAIGLALFYDTAASDAGVVIIDPGDGEGD